MLYCASLKFKCTVFWNCSFAIAVALCRSFIRHCSIPSDIDLDIGWLQFLFWSDDEIWYIEQWSKPTLNSELRHIIPPPHSLCQSKMRTGYRNKLRRKPHGPNPEPPDCFQHPPRHTFFKDYTRPILSGSILFFLPHESKCILVVMSTQQYPFSALFSLHSRSLKNVTKELLLVQHLQSLQWPWDAQAWSGWLRSLVQCLTPHGSNIRGSQTLACGRLHKVLSSVKVPWAHDS